MRPLIALTTLTTMIIFTASAFSAEAPNGCLKRFSVEEKWPELSEVIWKCITSNDEVTKSLNYGCNSDKSASSKQVDKYYELKAKYEAAVEKYKSAKTPADRMIAQVEMQQAQEHWEHGGFQNEVSEVLNLIESTRYHCTNK